MLIGRTWLEPAYELLIMGDDAAELVVELGIDIGIGIGTRGLHAVVRGVWIMRDE